MTTFADILSQLSDDSLERVRRKVPEWASAEGLSFPTRLSTEQCSSQETAFYKAGLLRSICDEAKPCVLDLTGGLGVDCWAFSRIAGRVHYNEADPVLAEAVKANFAALGVTNATFSNICVAPETFAEAVAAAGFAPDVIYLDPARRSETGRKVFLLEDCRPDVVELAPALMDASPLVLVKLSPMADISMVRRRLGASVREIHIVAAQGECKELLVLMERGWNGPCETVVQGMRFRPEEEESCQPVLVRDRQELGSRKLLFEPSAALLKAGCFNLLSSRFALAKLGRFTHLYVSDEASDELAEYGKLFSIKGLHSFDKRSLSALAKAVGRCEVTARNIPITSEALRKKMGVASGGDTHLFAFTADFGEAPSERLVLECSRIIRP